MSTGPRFPRSNRLAAQGRRRGRWLATGSPVAPRRPAVRRREGSARDARPRGRSRRPARNPRGRRIALELSEERQVEVDTSVGGAVEGPESDDAGPHPRHRAPREQAQRGAATGRPARAKRSRHVRCASPSTNAANSASAASERPARAAPAVVVESCEPPGEPWAVCAPLEDTRTASASRMTSTSALRFPDITHRLSWRLRSSAGVGSIER